MLRRFALVAVVLGVLCAPALAAPKPASKPAPPSVVAIVDVPRVLKESKAGSNVRTQLEAQRVRFQKKIAQEEAELRASEKTLIKLREAGKTEAFSELEQKLQKHFLTVERDVQARRKALDGAHTEAMKTVRKALVDSVAKIAQEKGVNLVVVKQQVIWNDKAIDLTQEVLALLDKSLPEVEIQILSDLENQSEKTLSKKN